jgi:UDP-glucuronate 4-epimerase
MKILLTGAAGFIGFHCAQRLLAAGHDVEGIDNLNDYYDPSLKAARLAQLKHHARFTFLTLDLIDHAGVMAAFERFKPDAVLHLAAQAGVRYSLENPRAYIASNVDGFLGILEACRHVPVRHLVYASSSSVYGRNTKVPFSESDAVDHPVSLYAATKRSNELMAGVYAGLYAIPVTGLRFFTVYGPWGRPDMAYYSFTKAILQDEPITLYDAAHMQRDFTYIDDVTEAIERLLPLPPLAGEGGAPASMIYNIGNHKPVSLLRFVEVIEGALGKKAVIHHKPRPPGDVPATYADVTALNRAVGFAPDTPLEVGIARFVDWYRGYNGIK